MSTRRRHGAMLFVFALALLCTGPAWGDSDSALSDEPKPYDTEGVPDRPRPVLELGEPFLATGPFFRGITLPTGAVWRPSFLVWGTLRSTLQTFDTGEDPDSRTTEWANRLDVFGQLRLSPTERFVVGIRPVDGDGGRFSGWQFEPENEWVNGLEGDLETLFFEGDLAALFPRLEPAAARRLDYGFSVGRQPLIFQDGMLLLDNIDSVGVVRNNVFIPGTSNTRFTFLYGWNHIGRFDDVSGANTTDPTARLYGLFTETDAPWSTINLDLAGVTSRRAGDGFYGAISFVQRIGLLNTTFRLLGSKSIGTATPDVNDDGALAFAELSFTPPHGHDLVYLNLFYGWNRFSSIARASDAGGPLGRVGILFAAVGVGNYGAPLGNRVQDNFGGSIGYQMFFDDTRRQLLLEVGGRLRTTDLHPLSGLDQATRSAAAFGARLQQAVGRRIVVIVDGFVGWREESDVRSGGRFEVLLNF